MLNSLSDEDRATVQELLRKILRDPLFEKSRPLSRFLDYIVTETLEGRAELLKGYNIAISVFDKKESFNPQTNSIVRVEATRLRKLLGSYYANAGRNDPIEIHLDRGTYVPTFVSRRERLSEYERPQLEPSILAEEHQAAAPSSVRQRLSAKSLILPLGLMVLLVGVAAVALMQTPSHSWQEHQRANSPPFNNAAPSITVLPIVAEWAPTDAQPHLDALFHEIISALASFELITVREGSAKRSTIPSDYVLIGRALQSDATLGLSFRFVRSIDNQTVWSTIFQNVPSGVTAKARAQITQAIADALAQNDGIVLGERGQRASLDDGKITESDCLILSYRSMGLVALEKFKASEACLQRALKQPSHSAAVSAIKTMADIDAFTMGVGASQNTLGEALLSAHRSVEIDRNSALAWLSLFMAQFYSGRFDEAFVSAKRAISINPYSTDISSRIGAAYIVRGEFSRGLELLQRIPRLDETKISWLEFYFFLASYMADETATANRHAGHISTTRTPFGLVARIVVANRSGDNVGAGHWINKLNKQFPAFSADPILYLKRAQMSQSIIERLGRDLQMAGLVK